MPESWGCGLYTSVYGIQWTVVFPGALQTFQNALQSGYQENAKKLHSRLGLQNQWNKQYGPRVFSWGFIHFVLESVSKGSHFLLSLQTKRALYLTKTPFQCNLHANFMPLYMHIWWEHFKNYTFTYLFAMKQQFYEVIWLYQLSWKCKLATITSYKADVSSVSPSSERMAIRCMSHFLATKFFHLATEKIFQSPLGACIKKLISDPVTNLGPWIAVRLEVTLFWRSHHCLSCVNHVLMHL